MDLTLEVTLIAIAAAVLHASWNAVAKSVVDKRRMFLLSNLVAGAIGLAAIPFLPAPEQASWPFLAAGSIMATLYTIVLFAAYRVGDLSLIYPTLRGFTPLMIALGAFLFAGEALTARQLAGVLIISLGILSLAFLGGWARADWKLFAFCVMGAAMISAYTVLDGMGVRRSGDPFAYAAWLYVLYAMLSVAAYPFLARWRVDGAPLQLGKLVVVGCGIALTYGLIVYALSHGAMAPVSALRETSILIAAAIGTLLMGEPFGRNRIIAASVVTLGLLVLKLPVP
jgi:drug/metabolite transporter (DMT)-like permease